MATTHCWVSSAPVKASDDPDPDDDLPAADADDVTAVVTVLVEQAPLAHAAPFHSAVLVMFPDGSDAFAVTLKMSV